MFAIKTLCIVILSGTLFISAFCMPDTVTFTFKELDRGTQSTSDYTVIRTHEGYHITVVTTKEKERATQDILCDSAFATLQWHYTSDVHTDILFRRNADNIELSGTFQGKQVQTILKIDKRPWYQIVPLGLQTISADSANRSRFWAVSLKKPAVLKAVCFCVISITNTALPEHPEIVCRRFHMKIEGLPTPFWTGDYYLRKNDNTFMYFEGHSFGAKKPSGTIEVLNRHEIKGFPVQLQKNTTMQK
jgi:hypothetical protein